MAVRDRAELVVCRSRRDTAEKHPDLRLPATQVLAEHRNLLITCELVSYPMRSTRAEQEIESPVGGPDVTNPLGFASRCDLVLRTLEREQVHRRPANETRSPTLHLENAAPEHADAHASQSGDRPVKDVTGEPSGSLVVSGCRHVSLLVAPCRPVAAHSLRLTQLAAFGYHC